MSSRFHTNRIRKHYSYSVQEVSRLLGVHPNTVASWLKQGLPKTDKQKPCLIYGDDLRVFLNERKKSRARKCAANEFYCFRCKAPRQSLGDIVDVRFRNAKTIMVSGLCEICGTALNKTQSVINLPKVFEVFDISKKQQRHIYESSTHSLNCGLRKDGEA